MFPEMFGAQITEIAQTMAPVQSFFFHTGEPPELPEPPMTVLPRAGPSVHVRLSLSQMMSNCFGGFRNLGVLQERPV